MAESAATLPAAPQQVVVTVPAGRLHLDYLDGLRALAALFVIVHHVYLTIWSEQRAGGWAHVPRGVFLYGHFAVTLFIIISGFCLMLPIARRPGSPKVAALDFYRRRVRRILPPYYCALLLSIILCATLIGNKTGSHWDVCLPMTNRSIFVHALLLNDIIKDDGINHALWSIPVECHIYLFFPLFIWMWARIGPWLTTAIAVVAGYAAIHVLRNTPLWAVTPQYYGLFVVGMLAAQIALGPGETWQDQWKRIPWFVISALFIAGTAFACARHDFEWAIRKTAVLDFPFGLGMASLLIGLNLSEPGRIKMLLSWRPLVWIGLFSYSVYLIHAPLLQVIWQYLLDPLHLSNRAGFALLAGPGTLLILALAYLFHIGCERPFMNTRPRS